MAAYSLRAPFKRQSAQQILVSLILIEQSNVCLFLWCHLSMY